MNHFLYFYHSERSDWIRSGTCWCDSSSSSRTNWTSAQESCSTPGVKRPTDCWNCRSTYPKRSRRSVFFLYTFAFLILYWSDYWNVGVRSINWYWAKLVRSITKKSSFYLLNAGIVVSCFSFHSTKTNQMVVFCFGRSCGSLRKVFRIWRKPTKRNRPASSSCRTKSSCVPRTNWRSWTTTGQSWLSFPKRGSVSGKRNARETKVEKDFQFALKHMAWFLQSWFD